jgi:hypothetical protein
MNSRVRAVADAVLYEGYMLYPYRPSSVKNRQRWTFGGLFPQGWGADPSVLHAELLLTGSGDIEVVLRFLHLLERDGFQEAMEREVRVPGPGEERFTFPSWNDGERRQERVNGLVVVSTESVKGELRRLTIHAENTTELDGSIEITRDEASMQALISAHALVEARGVEFISLTDPPELYREAAAHCFNVGVWPVLVGDEGSRDCMLVSPIILYDYPEVAPESPGDLFDGAEIDEILTLRILTLTEDEKAEMRGTDERTRRLLERTESLEPEELMKLHGVLRNPRATRIGQ